MAGSYRLSDKGLRVLLNFEGTVLHVYPDQGGVATVCVGHVVKPEDHAWIHDGVTREECQAALKRDVSRFERCVSDRVTVPISQPMADALVSLCFNIGEGAFGKSSVLRFLNEKKYSDAADAFLLWRFVRVQQKDGSWLKKPILLGRRESEAALFRSGIGEVLGLSTPDMPLETVIRLAVGAQFQGWQMVDDHGSLPAEPDNDFISDDGRLVALPPDEEEPIAA